MPVVDRLSYRPPTRIVTEKQEGPRPISLVGQGRGSSLQSFSQGQQK